jgi:Glycosyl hydrolase family 9
MAVQLEFEKQYCYWRTCCTLCLLAYSAADQDTFKHHLSLVVPVFSIVLTCQVVAGTCSDVAGEISAALAHAAVAFADTSDLSSAYWDKANMAYAQSGADSKEFGNSNVAYTELAIYYASTGLVAHVLFGAASMYTACLALNCGDDKTYLDHVMSLGNMKEPDGGTKWFYEVSGWDNPWWDAAVLMLGQGIEGPPVYDQPAFKTFLGVFADKWVNGKAPVECAPSSCL